MPTLKPRVQVTLEPETHAVFERLALLQGRSRGSVIAEFCDAMAPSLVKTIVLLEAAMEAPNDVKRGLKTMITELHSDLDEAAGDASSQLDLLMAQIDVDLGSEGEANPHLLTGGSGLKPKPKKPKPKTPKKPKKTGT